MTPLPSSPPTKSAPLPVKSLLSVVRPSASVSVGRISVLFFGEELKRPVLQLSLGSISGQVKSLFFFFFFFLFYFDYSYAPELHPSLFLSRLPHGHNADSLQMHSTEPGTDVRLMGSVSLRNVALHAARVRDTDSNGRSPGLFLHLPCTSLDAALVIPLAAQQQQQQLASSSSGRPAFRVMAMLSPLAINCPAAAAKDAELEPEICLAIADPFLEVSPLLITSIGVLLGGAMRRAQEHFMASPLDSISSASAPTEDVGRVLGSLPAVLSSPSPPSSRVLPAVLRLLVFGLRVVVSGQSILGESRHDYEFVALQISSASAVCSPSGSASVAFQRLHVYHMGELERGELSSLSVSEHVYSQYLVV